MREKHFFPFLSFSSLIKMYPSQHCLTGISMDTEMVKRKKGAAAASWKQQTTMQEQRRRKKQTQGKSGVISSSNQAASDSSNYSDGGSVSDSGEQKLSSRTNNENCKTSGNGSKKIPKKRGRKPRSTKEHEVEKEEEETEEEYQQSPKKKQRVEVNNKSSNGGGVSNKHSKKNKMIRISTLEDKPSDETLQRSGQSWVQEQTCQNYTSNRLPRCRECRLLGNQPPKVKIISKVSVLSVFCRFYAFRRLQYGRGGALTAAGFNDPFIDAGENDTKFWLPGKLNRMVKRGTFTEETQANSNAELDIADNVKFNVELAYQIIRQVGDQFCDMTIQEKNVVEEHLAHKTGVNGEPPIIWKRVVKGVREMCDSCDTTLFNYHWTCGKCGFTVCIDCYEARKSKGVVCSDTAVKGRDKFSWLLCATRQTHVPEQLLLTQVIPSDCLVQIDKILHDCRSEWGIPQHCNCGCNSTKPLNEKLKSLITGDLVSLINGNAREDVKLPMEVSERANGEDKNSSLNWLADVALQNQEKVDTDSNSDSDEDENHSTLRELLIRSHQNLNSGTNSPDDNDAQEKNTRVKRRKKSHQEMMKEMFNSVMEAKLKRDREAGLVGENPCELKHFVRRYKCPERGREPLPVRFMTLTESTLLYPEVPHTWLCNGKLLRLLEPNNPNNYRIFQDQWKRGQPVIVSDVHKQLDKDLWSPESFCRDFGEEKSDLVNCMSGRNVPRQFLWKFWEGFEHLSKRLKDSQGNPMLLKLKDWPSKGDFADILPSRFIDLMKGIPLSEYTHRYGRLNLTSMLPETFTRPDLGPKMYTAYGSAKYSDKSTTNLHLDVSDAVNVMVYVGVTKDCDKDEQISEVLNAIDEAGCDFLTRERVREKNEIPGALWHIYSSRDADKIRDMLNRVALENGVKLSPDHDPIHDQSFYLDGPLRERLYREYNVEGYAIVQCLGDAVFIPAGAPHQVRNLHNCIKVAEDFVSPENILHCFRLTQEFRALSDKHTNHEDKLQIKNIIYHAVKESLTVLNTIKKQTLEESKIESTFGNDDPTTDEVKVETEETKTTQ